MEAASDKASESLGTECVPDDAENAQPAVNGHTTAKPGWKAKREDWIKPENTSKQEEDSVGKSKSAEHSGDRAPHIMLDDEHSNGAQSSERKKSLPPIKVPEKTAEIPVIISRAVYNRHVTTPSMMGMGNESPVSPEVVDAATMISPMNLVDSLKEKQNHAENSEKIVSDGTDVTVVESVNGSHDKEDDKVVPPPEQLGTDTAAEADEDALPQRARRKRDKRMDQNASAPSVDTNLESESHVPSDSAVVSVPQTEETVRPLPPKEKKKGGLPQRSIDDEITVEATDEPGSAASTDAVESTLTGSHESKLNSRKVRDKSLDSYASVTAVSKKNVENKGGTTNRAVSNVAKQQHNGSSDSSGAKGSGFRAGNNGTMSGGGKFSSSVIPRDRKKFYPQGWVQAEFSDRQVMSDRSRTKEDIRNLEKAWQLRVDLDELKADELEKKLLSCQESVGAYAANMSITSRELRQQFQLLGPLKTMWQEAFDERERCTIELKKLFESSAQRAREGTFEDFKSLVNNAEVKKLRSAADIDKYVNHIESELETSLAGSDARFLMLKDKPNISSGGLRKVTNDSSALLRAEKDAIRKVQELKKAAPMVERKFEDQAALDQQKQALEHAREKANQTVKAITLERQKIRDRISALKEMEAQQRQEFEQLDKERNLLRSQLSNLRLEIKVELAERNKQRERYRFVIAQEEELLLRHQLRQNEIAGIDEDELRNQLEAVESARVAKEEAEAHARMLQSSIARFERIKAEVEGFLQPIPQSQDDRKNTSSTWFPSSESSGAGNDSSNVDEGELMGIPKAGWNKSDAHGEEKSRADLLVGEIRPQPSRSSESMALPKGREAPNPGPLNLPTVDESDSYNEPDISDDQSYRTLYNAQIYTPSMGDRVREERQRNTEYLEDESSPPVKSAIPVFKALDFHGNGQVNAGNKLCPSEAALASKDKDEVPLAPEFEEELKATMVRLFEIKQAQDEKNKPVSTQKISTKQKTAKVVKAEESDDESSEEVAPLGRMDPAFAAYREELAQEIDVAKIREKERIQREMRLERQQRSSAAQQALKSNQAEPTKSKSILSAIFAPSNVPGSGEAMNDVVHETANPTASKEHVRSQQKSSVNKRGKKKRRGSKRATADSDGDAGSDNEDSGTTSQVDAIRLAMAKVKRKEADRRFWRMTVFYGALAVLAGLFFYVLYESMSEPSGGRPKVMSPAQRSRLMSAGGDVAGRPGMEDMASEDQLEEDGSRADKEPLLQISIQGQDGKAFGEQLNVYHGLGDPEGVRRDVRAYVRRHRLKFEAEEQLYRSVIEQLEARVRGQIPFSGQPQEPAGEQSEVDTTEDVLEEEDEEEATDPEEGNDLNSDHNQWYEDEDAEKPKTKTARGPQQSIPLNRQPAAPRGMHVPKPTAVFGKGSEARDSSSKNAVKDSNKAVLEVKMKTASGEHLPPFPVYSDSTEESLTKQAREYINRYDVDLKAENLAKMGMERLSKRREKRAKKGVV